MHLKNADEISTSSGIANEYTYDKNTAFLSLISNSTPEFSSVLINATSLQKEGSKYFQSFSDNDPEIYWGGGMNKLLIQDIQKNTLLFDSTSFTGGVVINNLTRGASHNKTQPLTVNWSGVTNNTKVRIAISSKPLGPPTQQYYDDTTYVTGYSIYSNNTGSVTIPASINGKNIKPGYLDVSVEKYEPHTFTLSTGKKLCILAYSKSVRTIVIQ